MANPNLDHAAEQLMEWNNPFANTVDQSNPHHGNHDNSIVSERLAQNHTTETPNSNRILGVSRFASVEDAVKVRANEMQSLYETQKVGPDQVQQPIRSTNGQNFDISQSQGMANFLVNDAAQTLGVSVQELPPEITQAVTEVVGVAPSVQPVSAPVSQEAAAAPARVQQQQQPVEAGAERSAQRGEAVQATAQARGEALKDENKPLVTGGIFALDGGLESLSKGNIKDVLHEVIGGALTQILGAEAAEEIMSMFKLGRAEVALPEASVPAADGAVPDVAPEMTPEVAEAIAEAKGLAGELADDLAAVRNAPDPQFEAGAVMAKFFDENPNVVPVEQRQEFMDKMKGAVADPDVDWNEIKEEMNLSEPGVAAVAPVLDQVAQVADTSGLMTDLKDGISVAGPQGSESVEFSAPVEMSKVDINELLHEGGAQGYTFDPTMGVPVQIATDIDGQDIAEGFQGETMRVRQVNIEELGADGEASKSVYYELSDGQGNNLYINGGALDRSEFSQEMIADLAPVPYQPEPAPAPEAPDLQMSGGPAEQRYEDPNIAGNIGPATPGMGMGAA